MKWEDQTRSTKQKTYRECDQHCWQFYRIHSEILLSQPAVRKKMITTCLIRRAVVMWCLTHSQIIKYPSCVSPFSEFKYFSVLNAVKVSARINTLQVISHVTNKHHVTGWKKVLITRTETLQWPQKLSYYNVYSIAKVIIMLGPFFRKNDQ